MAQAAATEEEQNSPQAEEPDGTGDPGQGCGGGH